MRITYPFPGTEIVLLKEFSTKEEASLLYEYFSSMYFAAEQKDDSLKKNNLRDQAAAITKDLEARYIKTATDFLDFAVEPKFSSLQNCVYWNAGKSMLPHYDNLGGDHAAPVMYGCVYYLNDNFEGGELWYPNLGVEYKPVAGDMIIHPGSREYSHGIKEVISGLRVSVASFITQKDQSDDEYGYEY